MDESAEGRCSEMVLSCPFGTPLVALGARAGVVELRHPVACTKWAQKEYRFHRWEIISSRSSRQLASSTGLATKSSMA